MNPISRRTFLKTASASAACAAVWSSAPRLMANPLGLPIGLQLYSVRDLLPKDYEGTLRQLGALGYQEVEAAGFFGHSPSQVKQAMDHAGLNCVSAHYPLRDLLPKVAETIQFGKDLGLKYIVCAAPWVKDPSSVKDPGSRAARDKMTLADWRWNAEQLNHIGESVNAAGIRFATTTTLRSSAQKMALCSTKNCCAQLIQRKSVWKWIAAGWWLAARILSITSVVIHRDFPCCT